MRWKEAGDIFAIERNGFDLYPRYGFDFGPPCVPRPVMRHVLAALDLPPWETAWWFCCGCSALGGRRPIDMLAKDPEAVLIAASQ